MKKVFAIILVILLTLSCFAACGKKDSGSDMEYVKDKGKLVVGITDYEPMDYKDENGNWIGFDAELAQLFCKELGVECEFFVIADWSKKFYELDSKNIDVIWNGMTIDENVTLNTNCSDPYVLNEQLVIMKKDVVGNYTDVESLKGLTFAAENGSTGQDAILAAGIPEDQVVATSDMAAAVLEVLSGACDACVIDSTMANSMAKGDSYTDLAAGISLASEEYGVGFRKGSDLTAKLNELMDGWRADGTLQALADKYDLTLAQ